MLGRDVRTLNKLFEEVASDPTKYDQILIKAKKILASPQKKFIVGLRY